MDVSLGRLPPGSYTIDVGREPACSFVVEPAGECRGATADETRMPSVIYTDQQLAVTLLERRGGSCGCSPRVSDGGGTLDFRMELCGCCDACDCVDPGYEASREVGPLMSGFYEVVIPHGVARVQVVEPGSCRPLPITSATVIGPDEMLRQGGPLLWWARVVGAEARCCAAPAPAVEQGTGPMGEIVLSLATCVREDCECEPGPADPLETWHSMGELGPGTYTLVAGATRTTFVVP
jgi:hypothetical protein